VAKLREYQQRAIDQLYDWMRECDGNPCLVLPTGAGKSHVVAALCKDAVTNWPETRILMLTHVKELIEQNAEKMRQHWPNAPMGIYSASLGQKILGEPITFAGIQSIIRRVHEVGHVDLIIIDECHLVSHKDEGSYRTLINTLREINPRLRVIGLTATPYRLGHGLITEGPTAIFDGLIEPVTIEELIALGHLAPLRSKHTDSELSTEGVHTRGGEYIESELQAAVNTADNNTAIVRETFRRADLREHWLFFCAGVEHAEAMAQCLRDHGVTAQCVHGGTAKTRREEILNAFKAGEILALTNANVLTTGFDYPDIDLIVFARPTKSKSLYVQMAGRGLRPKSHTDHCLVLDFAGLVAMHGPITDTSTPEDAPINAGEGEPLIKVCDKCHEIVALSAKTCPNCGELFPATEPKQVSTTLHNRDIMQREDAPLLEMRVAKWYWEAHTSRTSGIEMLRVTYTGEALSDERVTEYYCVMHDGIVGAKEQQKLSRAADYAGVVNVFAEPTLNDAAFALNCGKPPDLIRFTKNGKFHEVKHKEWSTADATSEA
jgi:DNA repair protein RadD